MAKKKWKEIWESGIVFETAKDWPTEEEWLSALSNEVGHEITDEAIGRAWRRWQKKLKLPALPVFREPTVVKYPEPDAPNYDWFEAMQKRAGEGLGKKIMVIPDPQICPEVSYEQILWAAHYAVEKRPDIIVWLGDVADMPSLSSYDKGKRSAENKRYASDIEAANTATKAFMKIIKRAKGYKPRIVLCLGNHEMRIARAAEDQAVFHGTISLDDLNYERLGWEVYPFLQPVEIEGILFSHFFPRSSKGRITQSKNGAPSALDQVRREMQSCVAGHAQGLDVSIYATSTGTNRGVIAGSFYLHNEGYIPPSGQNHWRGILMLHQVRDGNFDLMEVSLEYLWRRYGKK